MSRPRAFLPLAGWRRCGRLMSFPAPDAGTRRRFQMSLQGHILELQRRHDALKREIEEEQQHHVIDEIRIVELKRKKLQIKDEIAKLQYSETRH
jgi:hypothetical protein